VILELARAGVGAGIGFGLDSPAGEVVAVASELGSGMEGEFRDFRTSEVAELGGSSNFFFTAPQIVSGEVKEVV